MSAQAEPDESKLKLPMLTGDGARLPDEEDEFGLRDFAIRISKIVGSRIAADGYAIGLEGEWGSGKSTLLNYLQSAIAAEKPLYHKVIRFDPWLIGKKRELLDTFFKLLIAQVKDVTSIEAVKSKLNACDSELVDRLIRQLSKYSEIASVGISAFESAASFDPTLHLKIVAWVLRGGFALLRSLEKPTPTLEDLKVSITSDLCTIKNLLPTVRFTVLIDDTDRLDPEESIEILRLVKAVANFPLVTYVVAFDRKIMSEQVEVGAKVKSGEEYLEKIFQQLVPIPPQEPFALRRFFRRELAGLFPDDLVVPGPSDLDIINRQNALFDTWMGSLLKTPRDAVRLLEAVKFGWPDLRGKADFTDFIWLQLVKLKNDDLYEWVEEYVTNLGSYRDSGRPGDREPTLFAERLRGILSRLGWSNLPDRSGISYFLPGIDPNKNAVFDFKDSREWKRFESDCRLGSPSHWRLYFAFAMPTYALEEGELDALIAAAGSDWNVATQLLRGLLQRPHQTRGHYLSLALDILRDRADKLSPPQQIGFALAFAEMMDEVPREVSISLVNEDPRRRAAQILRPVVGPRWSEIVMSGQSINWLCLTMRDQGYALGLTNSEKSAPDRQWLSETEFKNARVILFNRLRGIGIERVLDLQQPLDVLYFWLLLGDATEIRKLVADCTQSTEGFIKALTSMSVGTFSSNRGFYWAVDTNVVKDFFDLEAVHNRLQAILTDSDSGAANQNAASKLLFNWDNR